MSKKPSMGRQKIKIQKIQVKNHLQVTFSKRRSGLFKKASELCTLCGVEIAIIVFSPAGKVFSFGHPNVEPIVDRFLARNPADSQSGQNQDDPFHFIEAQRNAGLRELQLQLGQILNELEVEKKRGEDADSAKKSNSEGRYWWEEPVSELRLSELEQLREAMEELKKNVAEHSARIVNNPPSIFGMNGLVGSFDQYEDNKRMSVQALMGSANGGITSNFGYCHGFF